MPQVRYVVRVSDLEEHYYEHVFSYPAPDCFVNRAPTLEEETDLAVDLNKAHRQQILAARPFQCVGCGGKPEKLMEAPHLFLKDPADRADKNLWKMQSCKVLQCWMPEA
ncbi:TPA: hypothetical protein ACH3X3_010425 [Trebouxia sp. C0006]